MPISSNIDGRANGRPLRRSPPPATNTEPPGARRLGYRVCAKVPVPGTCPPPARHPPGTSACSAVPTVPSRSARPTTLVRTLTAVEGKTFAGLACRVLAERRQGRSRKASSAQREAGCRARRPVLPVLLGEGGRELASSLTPEAVRPGTDRDSVAHLERFLPGQAACRDQLAAATQLITRGRR